MTTSTLEPSLYDTGHANVLLNALTAVLLHQRSHHPGFRGTLHAATFECRGVLCGEIMDLAHNWPSVVSGENHAFTATSIADQIDGFLAKTRLDSDYADEHLARSLQHTSRQLRGIASSTRIL